MMHKIKILLAVLLAITAVQYLPLCSVFGEVGVLIRVSDKIPIRFEFDIQNSIPSEY